VASASRRLGEMPSGSVAWSAVSVRCPEPVEHSADEGGCVTMEELLMLFKDEQAARRPCPQPAFKTGCGQGDSCFANYKTCPVLLAPRQC